MELKSSAFKNKEEIPFKYSKEGSNLSPPLEWFLVPENAKGFAIICEDLDAPMEVGEDRRFTHWLIYNLQPVTHSLPEGIVGEAHIQIPIRVTQGKNSYGEIGYGGPMPPVDSGPHRYVFTLYALDRELNLTAALEKSELLQALEECTIATAQLVGIYERRAERGARLDPELF